MAGQAGDVVVDFTANPRPVRVYWKVDDDKQLNVFPFDGSAAGHDRFDVAELKQTVRQRRKIKQSNSRATTDNRNCFHLSWLLLSLLLHLLLLLSICDGAGGGFDT